MREGERENSVGLSHFIITGKSWRHNLGGWEQTWCAVDGSRFVPCHSWLHSWRAVPSEPAGVGEKGLYAGSNLSTNRSIYGSHR